MKNDIDVNHVHYFITPYSLLHVRSNDTHAHPFHPAHGGHHHPCADR